MKIAGAYGGANYKVLSEKNKATEKLSTGKKLNKAADNIANISISQRLESQTNVIGKELENMQNQISSYQVSDSGLENISENINDLKELSVKYNNGTLTENDKEILQNQANEILKNINETANGTEFNTKKVISEFNTEELGLSENLLGAGALDSLEKAGEVVNQKRGEVSGKVNSAEAETLKLQVAQENSLAASSRIEDADMLIETLNNTTAKILEESNLAVTAQSRLSQERIMDILKG